MAQLTLALIGATGCIGKEILDLLEHDERVNALIPIASKGTKESQIGFRGKQLSLRYLEPESFEGVDLAIAACPASVGKEGLGFLVEEGVPLIDLSGVWGTEAPLLAAGFDKGDSNRIREAGVVTAARPEAIVVARVLRVLQEVAPVLRVGGTLMMPAAIAGRDGVEELSRQVVSMFNSQEPPRKLFPEGLAFDVSPGWGGILENGWAGGEMRNAIQVGMLCGLLPQAICMDVCVLPLFAGMAGSLQVDLNPGWDFEKVMAALEQSDALCMTPPNRSMPRRMVGSTDIAVGRVRANLTGTGLNLWIACDPQRIAAANALSLMENLLWSES
jgi:aspartate-semialdehyde dehydrogenase